ncbi:hypothetical protein SEA_POTTY_49 [Microbacterium phage Potty]|nr:hypothetical protein SEA_POTTY_49 [Microbacterium phage Potty]
MNENKLYWHLVDEFFLSHKEANEVIGKIWSQIAELDLDYDIVAVEEIIKAAI